MRSFTLFVSALIAIILLGLNLTRLQAQSQTVRVVNKTNCKAHVTVTCSNSAQLSEVLTSQSSNDFVCPVSSVPCEVIIDLPGGVFGIPEVVTANPFTYCTQGGTTIQSNPVCYTG